MKRVHRGIIFILAALLLIFFALWLFSIRTSKKIQLKIGVFAGSNWDVAMKDSYVCLDQAIERFESLHPEVEVVYDSGIPRAEYSEYLSRRLLMNDAPDLMVVTENDFDRLLKLDSLENLDDWIADEETGVDPSAYYPSVLKTGQKHGSQWTLPVEAMPYLLFVNKTLLGREMVEIPAENFTFQELYDICRRVTKDRDEDGLPDQFGIYKYSWKDAAISAGASIFSEDGSQINCTSAELKQSVLLMQSLNALNKGIHVTQEDFDRGNVAFMPLSLAEYRTYKADPYKVKKYSNFQWDCIKMPRGSNGGNVSLVRSLNYGISSRSRHKALAWEFLKYISADVEMQREIFRQMPVASVLSSVMTGDTAEVIFSEVNNALVHEDVVDVILATGYVEPRFEDYSAAMEYIDAEMARLCDEDAQSMDIDSSLRTLQRKVQQYRGDIE